MNLGIPCTENRQSKRRGPPNRTLQRIKAQQAGELSFNAAGSSSPDSAAQALTTLANQTAAGVVVLGELQTVTSLLDDYFAYIHPVAPIPHEPTFRASFSARADLHDPGFVALVGAMLGVLTVVYPQRARMHFAQGNSNLQSFSANDYAAHCRSIVLHAMPPEYLEKRPYFVHDIIISYLLGLACMYEDDVSACQLYFNQCQGMISSGAVLSSNDTVDQELHRRTTWALFSSVKDLEHAGLASQSLLASIHALVQVTEMPLPNDDEHLIASGSVSGPHTSIPRQMVFDSTIRLKNTYTQLLALLALCTKGIIPWSIVQTQYQQAMADVDALLIQMPPGMSLSSPSGIANNVQGDFQSGGDHLYPPGQYPLPRDSADPHDRAVHEALLRGTSNMSKAILCANVLQVKSFLIEEYICGLQSHGIRLESSLNLKSPSEKSKSEEQTTHEAVLNSAIQAKDDVTHHVLNALLDITHREDTTSLNFDFVSKMRLTVDRLLNTPLPSPANGVSPETRSADARPTTPRGPFLLRAVPYLEAVMAIMQSLEHYLSVRGDRDGVETDVGQCWAQIQALGDQFEVRQMVGG